MKPSGSKISLVFLFIFIFFTTETKCSQQNKLLVYDLTCENLSEPLAINTSQPSFSWKNSAQRQGAKQVAYQILVAENSKKLDDDAAVLWNSGKIESSSSIMIKYTGNALHSGQLLYWKVRTWDENGNVSSWSKPAKFGIGLLDKNDWKASYIGFPSDNGFNASPQLRKAFSLNKKSAKGIYLLHVNSLGYHEVYINGKKVSEDVLSPAVSQFNKRSLINTYDVTPLLKRGNNDIVIWLGSGWYTKGLPGVIGNGPVVRAQMEEVIEGSKSTILVTDGSWLGRDSEYSRISDWWSGRYGGETVNGNQETLSKVFDSPEALNWKRVLVAEVSDHIASPQMVEPNKIMETLIPKEVERLNDSTYLVDMGKCLTGWFEISFSNLKMSQEVVLEYADHLDEKSVIVNQGQTDTYIASGKGTEVFKNKFNYHGFRYVKISNVSQAPQLTEMKAHLIHTGFQTASTFECSDKEINQIHDMILYTLKCVGLGGYLVDCPQIERLGYGGDGNASTITAQTMFNLAPLYSNWLQAWGDVIREDGSMPHTAPNPYAAGGGPYWCGFIISASWNSYQHYGDQRILEKYYPVMQKWLEYVDNHSVDGLLKRWPNTEYRNWYLGDWATPEGIGNPNHSEEKSVDLVNNCYISVCFEQMKKIAQVLGKNDDVSYYSERKEKLNKKIHNTFFDSLKGIYSTGSQIDLIFPMLADVVPQQIKDALTNKLIEITNSEYDGHLNTGLVGIPVMMEWAATVHQPDFIYSMLKKKTHPGYLFMLEQGATTTWEHWAGHRSRIHNCYNGVGQWFYQIIGGIRTIEGDVAYKRFLIDPQIPEGVTWAKTTKETPYGTISIDWELMSNKLVMEVKIPIGSTAILPNPEGTKRVMINKEIQEIEKGDVELPSGNYSVEFLFS